MPNETKPTHTIPEFIELLDQLIGVVEHLDMGETPKPPPRPPGFDAFLRRNWEELDPAAGLNGEVPQWDDFIKHQMAAFPNKIADLRVRWQKEHRDYEERHCALEPCTNLHEHLRPFETLCGQVGAAAEALGWEKPVTWRIDFFPFCPLDWTVPFPGQLDRRRILILADPNKGKPVEVPLDTQCIHPEPPPGIHPAGTYRLVKKGEEWVTWPPPPTSIATHNVMWHHGWDAHNDLGKPTIIAMLNLWKRFAEAKLKRRPIADTPQGSSGQFVNANSPDSNRAKGEGDVPNAMGIVTNPSDETAYRAASKIVNDFPQIAPDIKALKKILEDHPEIRRWKPFKQRLSIHLGDWQRFVDAQSASTATDGRGDDPSQVEKRKATARQMKYGK